MSSLIIKINFDNKAQLSNKIFKSIKKDFVKLMKNSPDLFETKKDKIFINYNIKN